MSTDEQRETPADRMHRVMSAADPYLEMMAERWHEEERATGKRSPWLLCSEEERQAARKRTLSVLAGEIRWSETGAGDRAIWSGGRSAAQDAKVRAFATLQRCREADRKWRSEAGYPGPHREGVYEIMGWSWYDTCPMSMSPRQPRYLFGNANIGNTRLCNLYVASMIPGHSAVFSDLYVTVSWPRDLGEHRHDDIGQRIRTALESTAVQLIIGERGVSPSMRAIDLLDRYPVDAVLAERQNFSVLCDPHVTYEGPPFDLVVHLDGAVVRSLQ